MEKIKVLIVDDNANNAQELCDFLKTKGKFVCVKSDSAKFKEECRKDDFDFAILDIELQNSDGFDVAMTLKKINKDVAIIFLTNRNTEDDKLRAFAIGADDYIVKPYFKEELVARCNAIARRSKITRKRTKIFEIGKFSFNYNTRMVTYQYDDGEIERLKLTSKEAEIMKIFCQNVNRVVERPIILQRVWHNDNYFAARSMDVYITKLRKYFSNFHDVEIVNQHGVGFKLSIAEED